MYKLGIRENNWPNAIEQLVLFEHIVEHYFGHRLDEIRLAFDMAIATGLPDENGEVVDVNAYENFSCLYFSKVFSAYRRWSAQEYKIAVRPDSPEQKIFTQEELDNSAREDAERNYQMFLRGIELRNIEITRPILLKDGLLKDDEKIEDMFLKRYENRIYNLYQSE